MNASYKFVLELFLRHTLHPGLLLLLSPTNLHGLLLLTRATEDVYVWSARVLTMHAALQVKVTTH